MNFLKATARRLAVLWLSPAGVFFALLSLGAWHYGPQIASRAVTVLDATNGAMSTLNRPQSGILAHVDGTVGNLGTAADKASYAISALNGTIRQASSTVQQVGNAATVTISKAGDAIQDTGTNLNRPCKGSDGPDACGTLAQVNKTVIKAGDAIVTTQLNERTAMDAWKTTAGDLDGLIEAPCVPGKPCTPYLEQTSGHVTALTSSWAEISGDFYDLEHPYVHPAPCKNLKCRIYRYVWTPTNAILQGSDAAYRASLWFRAMPVKVVP